MQGQRVETLVTRIGALDRRGVIEMLRGMECDFEIDFTDEFLNTISLERLKHIALAAGLHCTRIDGLPV